MPKMAERVMGASSEHSTGTNILLRMELATALHHTSLLPKSGVVEGPREEDHEKYGLTETEATSSTGAACQPGT